MNYTECTETLTPEEIENEIKNLQFDAHRVGAPGCLVRRRAAWLLQQLLLAQCWGQGQEGGWVTTTSPAQPPAPEEKQ